MTLTIPDDLANQLRPLSTHLTQILELGIRALHARHEDGFAGVTEVFETLAALPAPQEVLALRPSATLQARITELLQKKQSTGFSPEEQAEWDRYQYAEHLVRLAKARATLRLQGK